MLSALCMFYFGLTPAYLIFLLNSKLDIDIERSPYSGGERSLLNLVFFLTLVPNISIFLMAMLLFLLGL